MTASALHLLDSRGIGGIESHVLTLVGGLHAAGLSARIALLDDFGPHPLVAAARSRGLPIDVLSGFISLVFCLRRQKPALLHTHGYKAGILGRLAGVITRTPVVSTFHNGDSGHGRVRLYTALDRALARFSANIAVSEPILRRLRGRARLIGNFVAPADAVPVTVRRRIGFVGRLSHEKGPDRFCDLIESLGDVDAVIYGDGPMAKALRERYGRSIRFVGAVPDMAPHWPDIDLLVMPSREEGLPLAALEAMVRGIPVLATDVGDLPRVIRHGETGWIVPRDRTARMAEVIRTFLDLDLDARRRLSDRIREAALGEHVVAARLPEILAVYRTLRRAPAPVT